VSKADGDSDSEVSGGGVESHSHRDSPVSPVVLSSDHDHLD